MGRLSSYYAALKPALEGRPEQLEARLAPAQEAAEQASSELAECFGRLVVRHVLEVDDGA